MAICARCGHQNREGSRFCSRSGASLEPAPRKEVSPPQPPKATEGVYRRRLAIAIPLALLLLTAAVLIPLLLRGEGGESQGAMFRANPERTGEFAGPAPSTLKGERWRFKAGDDVESSPAVSGGMVFFGSHDGNIYALE